MGGREGGREGAVNVGGGTVVVLLELGDNCFNQKLLVENLNFAPFLVK